MVLSATGPAGDDGFWRGRRVLVTGHTGFKGAWLVHWLNVLGAEVSGMALPPADGSGLYRLAPPCLAAESLCDIRDAGAVARFMADVRPELVLHLAAQALVRPSYLDPVGTYATNVQGTLHVLEAVRATDSVRAALVVTTDKVYQNDNSGRPFRENDRLGGKDPYSGSKACAELLVHTMVDSYFSKGRGAAVATARAGNVIGGGDWGIDRLIPDMVRARTGDGVITLRHPQATRPWQHVLDCLRGYLMMSRRLLTSSTEVPPALNFGPPPEQVSAVVDLVEQLRIPLGIEWRQAPGEHPLEAMALTLDSTLACNTLGWQPLLTTEQAIAWTGDWYSAYLAGGDAADLTRKQINAFMSLTGIQQESVV